MNLSVILALVLAAPLTIDAAMGSAPVAAADQGWHAIGPVPRMHHAMAYDSARRVMVMFGGTQLLSDPTNAALGDTWEFSGAPDSVWKARSATGPSPRHGHSMVYDSVRQVMVLFGGVTSFLGDNVYSRETWEYDGTTWALRSNQGPSPRAFFAFTFDSARGVTVLHGGYDGARSNETWEYDGNAWTLRTTGGPTARSSHSMAFDSARNVCVMYGGATAPSEGAWSNQTWEYDGVAGTWTDHTAPSHLQSINHRMVFDPVRNITLRCGGDPFYGFHAWNGQSWTVVDVAGANSVSHRNSHACAYDSARQAIVMFGGYDDNGSVWNDTWEIIEADGGPQAVERNPAPHPGVRQWMFYDFSRRVACLQDADVMWEWDGAAQTWAKRPAPGPGWRDGASIAYDARRQVAVLFGGRVSSTLLGDTWEWNGRTGIWSLRATTGPSPRQGHDMAFDAARGVTVLFGGSPAGQSGSDETWEWDGANWTQRTIAAPPPRSSHAMVFDVKRNVTMLHGGTYGAIKHSDTWEFDGTQWTQRSNNGPSPHRTGFAMAYDGVRHQTLIFGGYASPYVNEVWTWDGTTWTFRALMNGPEPRDRAAMAFDFDQRNFVIVGGFGWIGPQRDQWLLCLPSIPPCPGDINGDGVVNVPDLLVVINQWGACRAPPQACPADISPPPNGDGVVKVADLLLVVYNWGACY